MIDPDARSPRCCATTASRCAPASRSLVRSTTLAAPLLLALQRAVLEREAWPLLRASLPDQDAEFWARARDVHLDALPVRRSRRGGGDRRVAAHRRAGRTRARSPASTRRGWPARRGRARRCARPTLARRWCGTMWPTPAGAQQAGMSTERLRGVLARALFLDRDDPVAAWRELRALQARLIARLSTALGTADRGRGNRPDVVGRRAARGSTPTAGATCRRARSSPGRSRRRPRAASASTIPTSPRGVEVAGIALEFREGVRGRARAPTAATRCCRRCSRPTTARAGSARSGSARTSASIAPIGSILVDEKMGGTVHLALGRSYPETGGTNESRHPLGHDLRPAPGRPADARTASRSCVDGRFVQSD